MKFLVSRYTQVGLAFIVAILLIAAFGSAAAAAPIYHTVHHGQTLYSIANHYGVSVWAIACANGIHNPNYIYAGQTLIIPKGGWDGGCKPGHKDHGDKKDYGRHDSWKDPYPKHDYGKPDYGKHDNKCCERNDHYVKYDNKDYGGHDSWKDPYPKHDDKCCDYGKQDHKGWDKKDDHKVGYPHPKPLGCWHTVRWGENLFRIALKYNLSWTVLAHANGLHNGNYLYAGQVLSVPCKKPVVY
jgi:LysM repeat protein